VGIVTLVAVLFVATTLLAQTLAPTPQQQAIAKLVVQMIEREHIGRHEVDDKISGKLDDKFIKDLDPQKLYFYQRDIDDFNISRTTLDDALRAGNIDFAYKVFNTYLKRLDERMEVVDKLIDAPQDFTTDETMVVDAKDLAFSKTEEELNERWRKRIKYDLLSLKLEKVADGEARERLHKRYRNIKRTMHQTDPDEILEMYLTALANCFDPHSSYMSPRSEKDFQIYMQLSLDGIGAALRSEDGYTVVAQIVPGGAAAADGRLKVGDKITAVGQEDGEMVDVVDMKLSNVVNLIRGKRGTKVQLKVQQADSSEPKVYTLTRQKIELKSQEVKGEIIDVGTRVQGARGKIGVIHIPSFYRDFAGAQNGVEEFKSTARDVRAVLKDFKAKGDVDAVVVDLRTNGGGALSEAIEVSGLFIDHGPVVQVKDQRGNVKSLDDDDAGVEYKGPLVVVCNRLSASASEIFAGVIKDYHRGLIVGDQTTHGKGTVQSVMNVSKQMFQLFNPPDRGALKLTINQFYRVNGDSTQNLGVQSDVALPSILDHMDLGEQFLDNAMAFDHIPAASHQMYNLVTPAIVSVLQDRSKKRVSNEKDFVDLDKDIVKYLDRKKRKTISLNEETLKQERSDEEKKAKKKVEEPDDAAEGPIFPDEYYNNEIMAITVDYINALRGMNTAKK
jgi:carboxyl-terminal processing protease